MFSHVLTITVALLHSLLWRTSLCSIFPSTWGTSFNILVVMIWWLQVMLVHFCLKRFCLHIWKLFYLDIKFLFNIFLSFSAWMVSFSMFWIANIQIKKSGIILTFVLPDGTFLQKCQSKFQSCVKLGCSIYFFMCH